MSNLRVAVVLLLTALASLTSMTAANASCGETTKFVQQVAGTNLYYGNRDTIWSYDHTPICSGGGTAQSTFVRLSVDYTSWAETGVSQYYFDSTGIAHIWVEYRFFPSPVVVKTYDADWGHAGTGRYYSFAVDHYITSTEWEFQWNTSSTPDTATWHQTDVSPNLGARYGEVESEMSRYGSAEASTSVSHLEKQNVDRGGWSAWTNLQCDASQNSITDWKAQKTDDQDWYMANISTGLC